MICYNQYNNIYSKASTVLYNTNQEREKDTKTVGSLDKYFEKID